MHEATDFSNLDRVQTTTARSASVHRVVHFAEILHGGPATYLNELLPFQVQAYERVTVFAPESQVHLITCDGVDIVPFPDTPRTPLGLAKLFLRWRQHLHAHAYDVIHLHSTFAGVVGRMGPRPAGSSIVYCPHGWAHARPVPRLLAAAFKAVELALSWRTDRIINVSKSEERLACEAGIGRSKLALVYSGIRDADYTTLRARANDRPTRLLFVGRYDRQKGLDLLIDALPELESRGFILETIGAPVVGKPAIATLPNSVENRGWQSPAQVREAMAQADVVVMPSRWEGFSLVALEAMRAGRPILAAAIPSLSEVVVDGMTGLLIAPNSAKAIVDGLDRLSAADLPQLGRQARSNYVEHFGAEAMAVGIDVAYASARANSTKRLGPPIKPRGATADECRDSQ